ncbi:unnamed protein product [Caenorhabditis brenneri]
MDANKRFEIRQRCPSLREFEKNVPLKIKSLVVTGSSLKVNDTTYKIGIIRKCNVGEAPKHVAEKNETGGDPYEVDGYGIKDESDALLVTPGDVVTNQRSEQFMRNEDMHDGHLEELVRILARDFLSIRADEKKIPSKYELFVQLTKSRTVDKKEQKTIQRYTHNKKYSEAIKQLATVLLGGRCSPIYVTKLQCLCSRIIRLPVGLQLKVEQLVFRADLGTSVGVLAPILHKSSYPLKKLDVEFLSDGDAANPIVNTAEILRIRLVFRNHLQTMSAITNQVVHLAMAVLHGPSALLEELVEHWIESKRPVGYT